MSASTEVAVSISNRLWLSTRSFLYIALLSGMTVASPLLVLSQTMDHSMAQGSTDQGHVSAKLVQLVQNATRKYLNVNNATAAGYGPFLGCVTGPDHGAMGIHYVNGALLNGELNGEQPPALIYEPDGNRLRLVGVEYILDAKTWLTNNNNTPPVLEGQVFQLVPSPNRFNLPTFFELHVWAWRENPLGAFVDWNTHVTCEHGLPAD